MDATSQKLPPLPKAFPKPNEDVLKWVGEQLQKWRGQKTTASVAKLANVSPEEVEKIEQGIIHVGLGKFRDIIQKGYNRKLDDVLVKCHEVFKDRFNSTGKRRYNRDYYFSVCLKDEGQKKATPFLVGGDPENFLWAVPIRKLKHQPLSVDLLALAPKRKKRHLGEIPNSRHEGVEIIHVINGSVMVTVETDIEDPPGRPLKAGDSIYLISSREHSVCNVENGTPALLMIVRYPTI
ncbi:MAG: cupin domain-containing protein [Patescibacteria group bacterium]|nr:cupin domain-containing protein [Patescibacteria group bacterium]